MLNVSRLENYPAIKTCGFPQNLVNENIFPVCLKRLRMGDSGSSHGEKSVASIASDAIALVASECSMQIM